MMKKAALLLTVLAMAGVVQGQAVFAPFVSRMRTAIRESQVKLTWNDVEDLNGTRLIYRHTDEITSDNLAEADLIAELPAGTESYIDTPPQAGSYHYAVIVRTSDGISYEVLIPFRNKTVNPAVVEVSPSLEERAARVTAFSVKAGSDSVRIDYRLSRVDRPVVVLRSTRPLRGPLAEADAFFVAELPGERTGFVDYVPPGVPYYYAILDRELAAAGGGALVPGENASSDHIMIALGDRRVVLPALRPAQSRAMPLPVLSGSFPPLTRTPLGAGARAAADRVVASTKAPAPPSMVPRVLQSDRSPSNDAEERILFTILTSVFERGEWREAEDQLRNFLSRPRTAPVNARSYFYLGQALYFQDHLQPAFMAFLKARDSLYTEVRPWMDAILNRLSLRR